MAQYTTGLYCTFIAKATISRGRRRRQKSLKVLCCWLIRQERAGGDKERHIEITGWLQGEIGLDKKKKGEKHSTNKEHTFINIDTKKLKLSLPKAANNLSCLLICIRQKRQKKWKVAYCRAAGSRSHPYCQGAQSMEETSLWGIGISSGGTIHCGVYLLHPQCTVVYIVEAPLCNIYQHYSGASFLEAHFTVEYIFYIHNVLEYILWRPNTVWSIIVSSNIHWSISSGGTLHCGVYLPLYFK